MREEYMKNISGDAVKNSAIEPLLLLSLLLWPFGCYTVSFNGMAPVDFSEFPQTDFWLI